ncbi:MAG: metallophosphoesterase [Anaerolineae bacterium]|nr:metallophosphoesterase [Anaerolineae bacterium]
MTAKLLTFVHISDTHLHSDPTYTGEFTTIVPRPGVEAMIQQINDLPFEIDFILHTGDVMTDPQETAEYEMAREVLGKLRWPVYYLAGNHDRADAIQQVLMGRSRDTIRARLDYEFERSGVQVICLDSSVPDPDIHFGHLQPEQLDWLDALCAAPDPRPLVVGVHHHALPLETPWIDRIILDNGEAMHRILLKAQHRLRGVFYGHIHESVVTVRDGISYYSVLSGWFQTRTWHGQEIPQNEPLTLPGFNVVTLTEKDTFVRYYRVKM